MSFIRRNWMNCKFWDGLLIFLSYLFLLSLWGYTTCLYVSLCAVWTEACCTARLICVCTTRWQETTDRPQWWRSTARLSWCMKRVSPLLLVTAEAFHTLNVSTDKSSLGLAQFRMIISFKVQPRVSCFFLFVFTRVLWLALGYLFANPSGAS